MYSPFMLFMPLFVSFAMTVALGYIGIPMLKRLHAKQSIREEGPESHQAKSGTPTMGGLFILTAIAVSASLYMEQSITLWLLLLLTLGHGALGFFDDFIKAVKKRNLGLTAKQKLLGQFLMAGIFCYFGDTVLHLPTTIWIPGFNSNLELGLAYYALVFIMIVGASNAVNLTDGLDGLASSTAGVAFAAYALIALWVHQYEAAIFSMVVVGACVGFLCYNANPAKVFMGDTGSLALGGALAGMAILTKTELLLVVVGGIFVMEALSVIIQVVSFKTRGVRVFKMSPIHHHFELSGWKEQRVVFAFWTGGIVLALIGIGLVFLRS